MIALARANYTYRMRGIEARRNAALRDADCASLRRAVQQEADLNHLFWLGLDVAPHVESHWSHYWSKIPAVAIVINDGGS